MSSVFAFVIGIPLAVELLGACFAIFDSWRFPEARAAAVERVAVPMLLWGGLWWLVGSDASPALLAALAFVMVWQLIAFYTIQLLSRWRRFQTVSVDTDSAEPSPGSEKRAPATMGIGEGRGSRRGLEPSM
jgi:hypothetical protein